MFTGTSLRLAVLAGLLSLVSVLPILYPLSSRLVEATLQAQQGTLELAMARYLRRAESDTPEPTGSSLADVVVVRTPSGTQPPDTLPSQAPCATRPTILSHQGRSYLTLCEPGEAWDTWAFTTSDREDAGWSTGNVVLALALIVGLATGLGMLQILAPLRTIPEGLQRLAQGERDVYLQPTGIQEVDHLIEHLNAAARAMEDREDAIHARAEVVTEVAKIVAHEIRNPLQTMELVTEVMSEENDPGERQRLAESLRQEISALSVVVNRLSHPHGEGLLLPRRTHLLVSQMLKRIVALRQPEARSRGIVLQLQEGASATLHADRALLVRAIENLIMNAFSFVPDAQGLVRVTTALHGEHLIVDVEDNGPGIDPALGDEIFQPGVSQRVGGSGLGLAFVRAIVEAHGGTVSQERSSMGGARFRLTLPDAQADSGPSETPWRSS